MKYPSWHPLSLGALFSVVIFTLVVCVARADDKDAKDKKDESKPAATSDSSVAHSKSTQSAAAKKLSQQRQAIADRIEKLSATGDDKKTPDKTTQATIAQLRALDGLYAQHQAFLDRQAQLEIQAKEAEKQLESLDDYDPDEPKPYSFLLLDKLKDQLDVEEDRCDALDADVKSAKSQFKSAHQELDEVGKRHTAPAHGESSTAAPADADLPTLTARAKVAVKQTEIEVQKLQASICKTTKEQLEKKIKVVKKDVRFTRRDRDKQLQSLAAFEAELKRQRQVASTQLQQVEPGRRDALAELEKDKAPPKVVEAATDAWRAATDVYQSQIVMLDQQLENLGELRRAWKRRFELTTTTVAADKMSDWLDDLDDFDDRLDDAASALEHRRDALRDQSTTAGAPADKDEALEKWTQFRAARAAELRDAAETRLGEIKATQRMLSRMRTELKAALKAHPAGWYALFGNSLKSILGYKVASDDEQSVTVGKMLILLTYVIAGVLLAYLISRLIGRRVLTHLGIHRGTADALRSILFYSLCIFFGVLAFQVLNIPLAAFAFLGGAAAIAIGFGGQDIMNNFMSGIILLTEQPIRVGDIVEIGGVQGVVMHIGLRSTRLQTEANHELIVPNKTLLDEQVTNLTLSDMFVRTSVTVTIDRMLPIQPAKWKMLELVFAHPMVMKSPRPVVLLKEFDTYWSTLEVHFWIQYANFMKSQLVQSQVLEAISEFFPQAESAPSTMTTAPLIPTESPPAAPEPEKQEPEQPTNAGVRKAIYGRQLKHGRGAKNVKI